MREKLSGGMVLIGLLGMVTIDAGQAIGPYIVVMAMCVIMVIAGARMGGWSR